MRKFPICAVVACAVLSGPAGAATMVPCEISAYGNVTGGVSFSGSLTDDGIDFLFDWRHSAPGVEFETAAADPDTASCNIDPVSNNADILGTNTATFNGEPAYSYLIYVEDNRDAPDAVILTSSIVRAPTRRSDGVAMFDPARAVRIPADIAVTTGASAMGWTRLHLDDITCRYRGTGSTYAFERCSDPLDSGYAPGDIFAVESARLRIQNADPRFEMTSVEVNIGTGAPAPGAPDFYEISVYDQNGAVIYNYASDVILGDIAITPLPSSP